MDKQLTVLITRPQPGADAFAEAIRGLPIVISPVMVIDPVDATVGAADVVVITSTHAIPAVPNAATCYCVGEATTQKAMAAGLAAIMAGETAEAVAGRIVADRPTGQIIYARGRHVAFDMVAALREADLMADEVVVYDQQSVSLSGEALDLLQSGDPVIVPLFSARSSALFFDNCPVAAALRVIAMSQAVADTVPDAYRKGLVILPNPDATTMAEAVRKAATGGNRLEQGQRAQ